MNRQNRKQRFVGGLGSNPFLSIIRADGERHLHLHGLCVRKGLRPSFGSNPFLSTIHVDERGPDNLCLSPIRADEESMYKNKYYGDIKMKNTIKQSILRIFSCLLFLLLFPLVSLADDSVCARVKIEIRQELTLERQAFDARMRINNGLDRIYLKNVKADVHFSDENGNSVPGSSDPANEDALFFIHIDSLEEIDNVEGTGTVFPSSSADIHWLIIPAPGASDGLEKGKLYYVGATLSYTINGEEHEIQVSPDYIFVKPMPQLTLDYFLPSDVYGDDAFTPETEPVIPFSLGVRVSNNGFGTAKDIKIDSAQPRIVENEQGLLINFVIQGTEVNGQEAAPTLLADFGDIEPNKSGTARWVMACSLSGQFVEFEAEFSHSDELGGELTSLLETANTHTLVRDVLADLPDRDDIRDFLAKDGSIYRIYESDNVDTVVSDQSSASALTGSGETYTLSAPVTSGFMYVQLADPKAGQKLLRQVIRSDGKQIREENAWLSKTRDDDNNWLYFVNLFDSNTTTTGAYTLIFEDLADGPQPPVLQFIPDRSGSEGVPLSFVIEASDPNDTTPILSASPLPPGASLTDKEDGTAIFDWTPKTGQTSDYKITFVAYDGASKSSQRAVISISGADSDGDNMPDYWEIKYFGVLDRDGTDDYDGDGISDFDEYLNHTHPSAMPGDMNNDGTVDLKDAVLGLKLVAGENQEKVSLDADVNGDEKMGLEEVIYILQAVSEPDDIPPGNEWRNIRKEEDKNNDGITDNVFTYLYDSEGNKVKESYNAGNNSIVDYIYTFVYDTEGKLIREEHDYSSDGLIDRIYRYFYDNAGNLAASEYDDENNGSVDCICTHTSYNNGTMVEEACRHSDDSSSDFIRVHFYDTHGNKTSEAYDDDNNGQMERMDNYSYDDKGNIVRYEWDFGYDGHAEFVHTCVNTYDDNGNIVKAECDKDRDGVADEVTYYMWE